MHTLEQQVVPSGITQSNITDQLLPEQPAQQADQQAPAPEEQAQQEPATAPAPEPPAGQPQETVALSATEVAPAAAEPQPEAQDAAAPAPAAPPAPAAAPAVAPSAAAAADSESDDDLPLAQRRLSGVNVAAKKPGEHACLTDSQLVIRWLVASRSVLALESLICSRDTRLTVSHH